MSGSHLELLQISELRHLPHKLLCDCFRIRNVQSLEGAEAP